MILFGKAPILLFIVIVIGVTLVSIPSKSKLGQIYFDSYQYEKAYKYLSEVKINDKTNVIVLKKIKDYFILQGDIGQALKVMQTLHSYRPHNLEYLKELEVLASWNELPALKLKYQEIRARLLPVGSRERESLFLEVAQGFRYLRDFESANRVFLELEYSENKAVYDYIINYYLSTKQADKVVASIERYKKLFEDEKYRFWLKKYDIYLYQTFSVLSEHDNAIFQALKILGINKYEKGRYPVEIESIGRKKLESNLYYIEGIISHYTQKKEFENVEKIRRFLVSTFPSNNDLIFELGEFYFRQKQLQKALETFDMLLGRKDLGREELLNLSERFYVLERKEKSIIVVKTLVRKFPKNRGYRKRLGDLLEEVGEKEEALEVFLELLKLEKIKSQSSLMRWFHSSTKLVFNTTQDNGQVIEKYQEQPKFNQKVKDVEQKIIYLLNDIGDADRMITVVLRLLNDDPYNTDLISALGQAYYTKGDIEEAERIFLKSYRLKPKQKMALEVLISKDVREENFEAAQEKLKNLEGYFGPVFDDYMLSIKEEVLFRSGRGKENEYASLCKSIINETKKKSLEFMKLKSRCFYRLGEVEKAHQLKQPLLMNHPEDISLRVEVAYDELERRNLKEAKKHIDFLLLNFKQPNSYKDLLEYYKELKNEEDFRFSWMISSENYILFATGFEFLETNVDISKGYERYRFGLEVTDDRMIGGGDGSFSFYQAYSTVSLSDKSRIKGSIGIPDKDKSTPFSFGLNYQYASVKEFLNLDYIHSRPALQTFELFNDKEAFERGISGYYELNWNKNWNSSASFGLFEANTSNDKGIISSILLSGDYRFKDLLCYQAGMQAGYSGISKSSTVLERGYLKESIPYYLMFKCNNRYSQNIKGKKWQYALRVGIGGDFGRNINFLKLNQFGAELSYLPTTFNSVKLYGEHYTEAINASRGETTIVGLTAQFYLF